MFAIYQRTQLAPLANIILQLANPKGRVVKTSFIEQECKEIYEPFDLGSILINQVFPEGKEVDGNCHHKDPESLTPIESHNPNPGRNSTA